jgi:hypothetical protein
LEEDLYKLQESFDDISQRLVKLEAWIPLIISIIFFLFIWNLWSTYRLAQLQKSLKSTDKLDEPKNRSYLNFIRQKNLFFFV